MFIQKIACQSEIKIGWASRLALALRLRPASGQGGLLKGINQP